MFEKYIKQHKNREERLKTKWKKITSPTFSVSLLSVSH